MLSDIVVLDLSRALAGPSAAQTLGDLGATVIKIETPHGGDDSRSWGPPFVGPAEDSQSTYFLSCNRNKQSVTVDLRSPDGRRLFTRLVMQADVLVENFRVGGLDRLDLGHRELRELNPRLIICSITGFGHDGPDAGRAGYDQIAQGEAGLMSLTGPDGHTPTKVGVPIADILAGMNATIGILAALHERVTTGLGRTVRTSLLAGVIAAHTFQGTRWTVAGETPTALGNQHPSIAPYGLYRTADSAIQVSVGSDSLWARFAALLGIDGHDARFATNHDRVAHRDALTDTIEAAFAKHPADYWLAALADAGIPVGMVRSLPQAFGWDQTIAQGLLVDVDHPTLGPIQLPGSPLRFDDNHYSSARARHLPPPRLGEHNDAVHAWLHERERRASGAEVSNLAPDCR